MQLDLTAMDNATLVFVGTLVLGFVLAAFVLAAGLVALLFLGVGKLGWTLVSKTLLAVVHGINAGWDRLLHPTEAVEAAGDFQGQPSSGTGSYPRVILRDS